MKIVEKIILWFIGICFLIYGIGENNSAISMAGGFIFGVGIAI